MDTTNDLVLIKLDRMTDNPYVVFGPQPADFTGLSSEEQHEQRVSLRPKYTMTIQQWEALGSPTSIRLDVAVMQSVQPA